MIRALVALLALVFASSAAAQTPVADLAQAPPNAETWSIFSTGGRHGQFSRWTGADGVRWSRESVLLRGFVTEVDQQLHFTPDGALTTQIVRGVTPSGDAAERFVIANGRYEFHTPVDHGADVMRSGVFYASFGGTMDANIALADALRAAPNHSRDMLPSGRARLEQLATLEVNNGHESKQLTAYSVVGLGLSPFVIWYDHDRFFGVASYLSYMPIGWESVAPALSRAQDEALAAQAPALVARIAPKRDYAVAFQNVRLYDAEAQAFRDAMTVVVNQGLVTAVGPADSVPLPAHAEVFQGGGRTLVPGLWDSHQHYGGDAAGPLLLAQGITSVRDPGNQVDELLARRRRIEAGELLGTRIVASMLIDGPGPMSAQVATVVHTRAEAIAAVRRAHDLGYFGVKLYGSLDPRLVRPMAQEAHRLGLRVHGHIPAGMRPLEAVRAGYDEITHINFAMMQAMPDEVVAHSNGLQRFYGPGRYAGDVDLHSPAMTAYLDELQRRHTAFDPTLSVYEGGYVPELGEVAPAYRPFLGAMPPQVERGFRSGSFSTTPEVSRAQMRRAYLALQNLVAELNRRHMTMVAGTDGFGLELVRELELYVAAGMSPAEALATATITPARTFGVGNETGSIAVGKKAELFLVDGDPGRDIGDLRNVVAVMRDGRLMMADDLRAAVGISGPPHAVH